MRRPSPSLILSIVAVVMASAGTSVAAINYARNAGAVDGKSAVSASASNAKAAGIAKLDVGTKGALVSFHGDQFANVPGLIAYAERLKGRARIRPDNKLSISGDWVSTGARLNGAIVFRKNDHSNPQAGDGIRAGDFRCARTSG